MQDFRNLKVWERAHQFVVEVYNLTGTFPKCEQYGLTSQIQRAAVSIVANIAEGCGRNSEAELARFFEIAMGSASELEYHFLLSFDLGLLPKSEFEQLRDGVVEVKQMLTSFIKKLRADGR